MAFVPSTAPSVPRRSQRATCSRLATRTFLGARLSPARQLRTTAIWSMNISTNDFRVGSTIELDGVVHRVQEFLHVKPGKGAAFVRTKLRNMKTGNTVDKTFKAGEMVKSAVLEKITMQHTYVDGSDYVFMNMESFEEERMSSQTLGGNILKFLSEGLDVEVLKHNEDILGIEIPKMLSVEVIQTDPGAKGNTAQGNATKPATVSTGAEVMVPLFIQTGERITVNTEDGKYVGRDKS